MSCRRGEIQGLLFGIQGLFEIIVGEILSNPLIKHDEDAKGVFLAPARLSLHVYTRQTGLKITDYSNSGQW